MARLFHITVGDLIASATRRMKRARVFFGHGTDNARDEAVALVLHVMKLPYDAQVQVLARRVSAAQRERFEALLKRRIAERVPLPYLTNEAWFAGPAVLRRRACADSALGRSPSSSSGASHRGSARRA